MNFQRPLQVLPAQPGKPKRYDYEYEWGGTANVSAICARG
jgi:hypothetical protein